MEDHEPFEETCSLSFYQLTPTSTTSPTHRTYGQTLTHVLCSDCLVHILFIPTLFISTTTVYDQADETWLFHSRFDPCFAVHTAACTVLRIDIFIFCLVSLARCVHGAHSAENVVGADGLDSTGGVESCPASCLPRCLDQRRRLSLLHFLAVVHRRCRRS